MNDYYDFRHLKFVLPISMLYAPFDYPCRDKELNLRVFI